MPRCSEEALESSLEMLSEHAAANRKRSNWMSTFLVAQRMEAAGYPMTIAGSNSGVNDVFALIPDHERGRVNPFVDLASGYRWGQVEDSGRKTVWNTGTRRAPQRVLFVQDHFQNGLKPTAVNELLAALGTDDPLPARGALSVLLTRTHDWKAEPTKVELSQAAADFLGMSIAEYQRITEDRDLPVPVLGAPEWTPDLLRASDLGPVTVVVIADGVATDDFDVDVDAIRELPDTFRRFLDHHGVTTASQEDAVDLLAATLSSQFVLFAGPSGTGKSLMSAALSSFFAPVEARGRLESSRLLARPQEFFGYYSYLAGESFEAYDQLLRILPLASDSISDTPMITVEEANLSPIEGYFSPLVHGFGGLEAETLLIPLHSQPDPVQSQVPAVLVPPILELGRYPRIFATLNVDADSPAPARKVVSRACVILLEPPTIDVAMLSVDAMTHPSLDGATGPAAGVIGRPTSAYNRYVATGSDVLQQAWVERLLVLRDAVGLDVGGPRQYKKSLIYMAWYVELAGTDDLEVDADVVRQAVDNAILHFVLPSLSAEQFEKAADGLNDGTATGALASRLERLRAMAVESSFGPPQDFWGALT